MPDPPLIKACMYMYKHSNSSNQLKLNSISNLSRNLFLYHIYIKTDEEILRRVEGDAKVGKLHLGGGGVGSPYVYVCFISKGKRGRGTMLKRDAFPASVDIFGLVPSVFRAPREIE